MKPKFGPASQKQRHPVHPQHDNVYFDPLNMGTNEHTEGSADKRTNQKNLFARRRTLRPVGMYYIYIHIDIYTYTYIYILYKERERFGLKVEYPKIS